MPQHDMADTFHDAAQGAPAAVPAAGFADRPWVAVAKGVVAVLLDSSVDYAMFLSAVFIIFYLA
jgi:hypothetical protein